MCQMDRDIKQRLAWFRHVNEISHSVAKTCRYYGISRTTYYKWFERLQENGADGLKSGSRRPHNSPRATARDVVEKVLYLRRYYHFGPLKIKMYLNRYHDIELSQHTIWIILRRAGMSRLPANMRSRCHRERYRRYEKPLPGNQVQIDVKFLAPLKGQTKRFYPFTAIDDCTRIRVLKIYERNTQKSAINFVDYALSKLPFRIDVVQTDNGAEFQQQFHWHLLDKGIHHRYIRPLSPHLNGKIERSHRIDEEEFYRQIEGIVVSSADQYNKRLEQWERFYNYERPHGSLGGQTPYERLRQKIPIQCQR